MKKIKFFSLFLALCLSCSVFAGFPAYAEAAGAPVSSQDSSFDGPGPSLNSYSAIILDRKTGDVLYSQRADARVYPADTAKLMTALLAVEAIEQGDVSLTGETQVSATAVADLGTDATRLLTEGETITLGSLLYCTILASADDAANAIAEYLAGDQASFVEKMNERATRLGCTGTQFTNPSGLYVEENYSTAADMALIAMEATRHDLLWRICTTKTYDVPETDRSGVRSLKTTNPLLVSDGVYGSGYLYQRATGVKSGYNAYAGYCLISSAEDEESGIQLLTAVFGGQRGDNGITSFRDAVTLFDWVFSNYSYQEVLSPTKNIASVDVNLGLDTDYVNLRPAAGVTLLLPNHYDAKAFDLEMTVYSLQQGKIVTAPVTAGEVLGEVSVIKDGQNYGTVKLVAATNVDLSRSRYISSHIQETLHTTTFRLLAGGLLLLLAAYLTLVIRYRMRRRRYKQALKQAREAQARKLRPAEQPQEQLPEPSPEPSPEPPRKRSAPQPQPEYFGLGQRHFDDEPLEEGAQDSPAFFLVPPEEAPTWPSGEADEAFHPLEVEEAAFQPIESADDAWHSSEDAALEADNFDFLHTQEERAEFEDFFRRK